MLAQKNKSNKISPVILKHLMTFLTINKTTQNFNQTLSDPVETKTFQAINIRV